MCVCVCVYMHSNIPNCCKISFAASKQIRCSIPFHSIPVQFQLNSFCSKSFNSNSRIVQCVLVWTATRPYCSTAITGKTLNVCLGIYWSGTNCNEQHSWFNLDYLDYVKWQLYIYIYIYIIYIYIHNAYVYI